MYVYYCSPLSFPFTALACLLIVLRNCFSHFTCSQRLRCTLRTQDPRLCGSQTDRPIAR